MLFLFPTYSLQAFETLVKDVIEKNKKNIDEQFESIKLYCRDDSIVEAEEELKQNGPKESNCCSWYWQNQPIWIETGTTCTMTMAQIVLPDWLFPW